MTNDLDPHGWERRIVHQTPAIQLTDEANSLPAAYLGLLERARATERLLLSVTPPPQGAG